MGNHHAASIQDAFEHHNYKKFKEILHESSDEDVAEWLVDGRVRCRFGEREKEMRCPLEYWAEGFGGEEKLGSWLGREIENRGVFEKVLESREPGYLVTHVLAPAVRRDVIDVVKGLLCNPEKSATMLTTAVFTRYAGGLIHSTIAHLSAEQSSLKSLSHILTTASAMPPLLTFLLTRKDGLGHTIHDVASRPARDILSRYPIPEGVDLKEIEESMGAFLTSHETGGEHEKERRSRASLWLRKFTVWE